MDLAIEQLRAAAQAAPHAVLFKALADLYGKMGRGTEAWEAREQSLKHRAHYALGYYARAASSLDPASAERDLRQAIEIAPELWLAWERLQVLLARDPEREDEIMDLALETIRIEPRFEPPYTRILKRIGHEGMTPPDPMEAVLNEAIRAAPDFWLVVWTRAQLRRTHLRYPEAIEDLTRVRDLLPSDHPSHAKAEFQIELLRKELAK